MAKESLHDRFFSVNRWFRRIEFSFEKNAWLPVSRAVECCLSGFRRAAIQSSVLEVRKKTDRVSGAIFGHTPARQATRILWERLRVGGVGFATPKERCYDTARATFRSL